MIGILGGTFDPIHYGHLRTALEVAEALALDELRLIPLRDPPHRNRPSATADQRLTMLQAAVEGIAPFRIDQRELQRSGKSYSVDTLRSLRQELGEERPICLLVGTDAFRGFPEWHQPEQILQLTHILVMQRPGEAHPAIYPERTVESPERLHRQPAGCILYQPVTQLEISSTAIRDMIRQGHSPRFLLPDPVLEIIQHEGLYR